jgi:hypothetical protein
VVQVGGGLRQVRGVFRPGQAVRHASGVSAQVKVVVRRQVSGTGVRSGNRSGGRRSGQASVRRGQVRSGQVRRSGVRRVAHSNRRGQVSTVQHSPTR